MGKEETTWAAANVLEDWISKYGIPQALYTDWKNVYKRAPTSNELSRGETRCLLSLGGCARSLAHIARFAVSPASPVVYRARRDSHVLADDAVFCIESTRGWVTITLCNTARAPVVIPGIPATSAAGPKPAKRLRSRHSIIRGVVNPRAG